MINRKAWALMLAALILASFILSSCSPAPAAESGEETVNVDGLRKLEVSSLKDYEGGTGTENMKIAADNGQWMLLVDPATTDIAVVKKDSDAVFHSNPARTSESIGKEMANASGNSSLINLEYIALNGSVSSLNSANDAVAYGQFDLFAAENGIKIRYTLGKDEGNRLLPPILSVETYEELAHHNGSDNTFMLEQYFKFIDAEKTSAEDKADYLERFPRLADTSAYVMRNLSKGEKKLLENLMTDLEFTKERLDEEAALFGGEAVSDSVLFGLVVELTLTERGLDVGMDLDNTSATKGYKISRVELMKGFNATDNPDGFIFMPDGSGAVFGLKAKGSSNSFSKPVYGDDLATAVSGAVSFEAPVVLPVFAIKSGSRTAFATIENGAGLAYISARFLGDSSPIAGVNPSFRTVETELINTEGMMFQPNQVVQATEQTGGRIDIRYSLFDDEDTDYVTLAKDFRSRLISDGTLKAKDSGTSPFFLELIGAAARTDTAGTANKALTTYEQATDVVAALLDNGVENIRVRYRGWANEWLSNAAMDRIRFMGDLGGKSGFQDMLDWFSSHQIAFYPEAELNFVSVKKGYSAFNPNKDAARRITRNIVKKESIDPALLTAVEDREKYALSPDAVERFGNSFISDYSRYSDKKTVSIGSIGAYLYANLLDSDYITRNKAEEYYRSLLDSFRESGFGLMVDRGNYYTWGYADTILNLPSGSSDYAQQAESVPFLQIVLHGYKDYAAAPFNQTGHSRVELLRAVETGSSPYYRMTYAENIELLNTEITDLYSLNYTEQLTKAKEAYSYLSRLTGDLSAVAIDDHSQAADGVYLITYENGCKIYVNYNAQDVQVGPLTVPALDCLRVEA